MTTIKMSNRSPLEGKPGRPLPFSWAVGRSRRFGCSPHRRDIGLAPSSCRLPLKGGVVRKSRFSALRSRNGLGRLGPAGRMRGGGGPRRQGGIVLAVSLILLLVLTLVAVIAMRGATLDLKIVKNTVDRNYAFEVSEGSRQLANTALDQHTHYRDWSSFSMPAGLAPVNSSSILFNDTANLGDLSAGNVDMEYRVDSAGGTDYDDATDLRADIFVTRVDSRIATGAGAAIGEGYAGLGQGAAAGGGLIFFDLRSVGMGVNNASATTGTQYRHVIR